MRKVILVEGPPKSGKTSSIRNIVRNTPEKVAYINIDGKEDDLPFKIDKIGFYKKLENPLDLLPGIQSLDKKDDIEYIVIDTLSEFASRLEFQHVVNSEDSRSAWQKIYAQQIKELLEFIRFYGTKTYIVLSHTMTSGEGFRAIDKAEVKGQLGKRGLEYFFAIVLYATTYERENGVGYGFLTGQGEDSQKTGARSPIGMFEDDLFKSNDILKVIKKIEEYDIDEHVDEYIDDEE